MPGRKSPGPTCTTPVPRSTGTNTGWRQLYDTTVLVNANDNFSYYLNFDYGRDKNVGPGAQQWTGVAGAARYAIGKKYALPSRLEWYDDMDGFTTGLPQTVKEVTLTGEYKANGWLLTRLEFRDDWSNQSVLPEQRRHFQEPADHPAGMVAFIGPKK